MKKKKFWRTRNVIFIVVGLLIIGGVVLAIQNANKPKALSTETITRGEVVSEVSATGKVTPVKNIDMSFQGSGRLSRVYVSVGSKVTAGQALAELENGDLRAQVAQAQASLRSAQANLAGLVAGARPEQLQIDQAALNKANQDLANLYGDVKDTLNAALANSDDAVRTKIGGLFNNGDTDHPTLTFSVRDSQIDLDMRNMRVQISGELTAWRAEIAALPYDTSASHDTLTQELQKSRTRLGLVDALLVRSLDGLDSSISLSATDIATYRSNVNTARTNVNASRTAITNLFQSISTEENVVKQSESALALDRAGATQDQIAASRAQVDQAQANVQLAQAQLGKSILSAPFTGTVTKVAQNPGDSVSPSQAVVSLIGTGNYEIDVNIAESDIPRVKVGETAKITFDAYGTDVVFDAKVIQIDLSETVIDNVATYKTVLQFLKEDPKIVSGFTANITIQNENKQGVLYVYTRDIITDGNKKYVKLVTDKKKGTTEQVEIETGLRGTDGKTEVTGGLKEGDEIVTS